MVIQGQTLYMVAKQITSGCAVEIANSSVEALIMATDEGQTTECGNCPLEFVGGEITAKEVAVQVAGFCIRHS